MAFTSFTFDLLPNELQVEIIKHHVWPSRVLAVKGSVEEFEMTDPQVAGVEAEDFSYLDLKKLLEGPSRVAVLARPPPSQDTVKRITLSIASDCNRIYLGLDTKTQALAMQALRFPTTKQMILHNPNACFYFHNIHEVVTSMDYKEEYKKENKLSTGIWEHPNVTNIAFDQYKLRDARRNDSIDRIEAFARFLVRFPQIETINLVVSDTPRKARRKDAFEKAVYGIMSRTGVAHTRNSLYSIRMEEYRDVGRTAEYLRVSMRGHERYRTAVADGSRKALVIKLVRWA